MATIVITLDGGLVRHVASDVPNLRVLTADFDVESAGDNELCTHDTTGPFVLTEETASRFRPEDLAVIETADAESR
ncbi:MAG: hypothetical protein PHR35_23155 [Kiritimatiellae bacterium]|nr:hypothetical protein [Kiritimatiellia bacterium]